MSLKKQAKEIWKLMGIVTQLELSGEYETADVIRQDIIKAISQLGKEKGQALPKLEKRKLEL